VKGSISRLLGASAALTVLASLGVLVSLQPGRAQDNDNNDNNDNSETQSKIKIGFQAAPVPLNLTGKNRSLVGLGSYLVNAAGDCNGCHSAGPPTEYAAGGNPYFGQHPEMVNQTTYLGGGRSFMSLIPGSAEIISRNLTPDKTGRPEGGATFAEFVDAMRTGVDRDKWHLACTGAPNAHCIPPPFDGSLLQVMPWPVYSHMTDRDLRAIYEYLSAIPCLEGDPGNPAGSNTNGHRCK